MKVQILEIIILRGVKFTPKIKPVSISSIQCVGQFSADVLAAYFFARGTEAAGHMGCTGHPTPIAEFLYSGGSKTEHVLTLDV